MAGESDKDKATDWLQTAYNGITSAMDDIRHKVVEEPWFHWNGRAVTGDTPLHRPDAETPQRQQSQTPQDEMPSWASYGESTQDDKSPSKAWCEGHDFTPDSHYQDNNQDQEIER